LGVGSLKIRILTDEDGIQGNSFILARETMKFQPVIHHE
jgi:hypothetical protein